MKLRVGGLRLALGAIALSGALVCAIPAQDERRETDGPATEVPPAVPGPGRFVVDRLSLERFRQNIETLAGFGTRYYSQEGNRKAVEWLATELESYGYVVERHAFVARGRRGISGRVDMENVYATRVGKRHPDRMYIVSAHLDSFNTQSAVQDFAPGANDDASGSSLVLEAARVFAALELDTSVRFILWNAEEIGLVGAKAYVRDRHALQGVEAPPGSGVYSEPRWLGVVQHDMILFDHGMPRRRRGDDGPPRLSPSISRRADLDIEYSSRDDFGGRAVELAVHLLRANSRYSANYPAEIGAHMSSTDSVPFAPHCPAVSVRENRRLEEIGRGGAPHWHKDSDVPATYSDEHYRFGFNAVQMTVGAIAELAGARPAPRRRTL